jgi:hypothetical protein
VLANARQAYRVCEVDESTRLGGIGLVDPDPPPYFGATPITEAWVVESDGLIVKASPTDIGCFAHD